MTDHTALLKLLGEWVTVTHPHAPHRTWYGRLASLMDEPALALNPPEGGTLLFPQSFNVTGAAPATGGPHPDPDIPARPFEQLRETGLLWLINRVVFHPRGLALALHLDADGLAYGWSLVSNLDGEPWQFDPATDNDGYVRAEKTIQHAHALTGDDGPEPAARCCVCGGGPVVYEGYRRQPCCAGCAHCGCGQEQCARSRPDDVRTPPDADVRTGGHVRTLDLIGETGCVLTCPDTIRTASGPEASGRPDAAPVDFMPSPGLRAILSELGTPKDTPPRPGNEDQ
ncbi:hypothetical protein [Streptomyces parvulus]|uniref:hypothetical protein n=1 Tax=Streptomyces parvulus TaxID=146923 RepID=UPI0037FBCAF7